MNSKRSILAMGLMATILGGGVSSATEERTQMGETQNLWEEDAPVARSLTEIQALAEHADQLKGKVVTIEGVELVESIRRSFNRIVYKGNVERVCFNKCPMTYESVDVFSNFDSGAIAITDCGKCGFSPRLAKYFLQSLSLDGCPDIDLSNNNLGEKGGYELLEHIGHVVECGLTPFRTLNLSNNGFKHEDIVRISDRLKSEHMFLAGCIRFE